MADFADERNLVGAVFPKIETALKDIVPKVERRLKLPECTLLNLTHSEATSFFATKQLSAEAVASANKRAKGWFFMRIFGGREYVCSGFSNVEKIYSAVFKLEFKPTSTLKGTSAFPGEVRGRVRVLPLLNLSPLFEFNEGDILVSVHTNPDLLTFIKRSAAIVTDEGGILAHAAVISRELKKPCVTGTKISTKALKTGDFVEVDATKGVVRILKRS